MLLVAPSQSQSGTSFSFPCFSVLGHREIRPSHPDSEEGDLQIILGTTQVCRPLKELAKEDHPGVPMTPDSLPQHRKNI